MVINTVGDGGSSGGTGAGAKLNLGADQTITDSTWTQVNLDNVVVDDDGGADLTNDQYVIPADGTYMTSVFATFSGITATGRFQARIMANGTDNLAVYLDKAESTSIPIGVTAKSLDSFVSGDTVHAEVWQNTGSDQTVASSSTRTFLLVERIS